MSLNTVIGCESCKTSIGRKGCFLHSGNWISISKEDIKSAPNSTTPIKPTDTPRKEWEEKTEDINMTPTTPLPEEKKKIILDLCGGTGAWSRPYKEAGYDVRLVTIPEHDVRKYEPPDNVYGILAAPPCTDFSVSGAQYWKVKDKDGRTIDSMGIVMACLMIIAKAQPKFWVMENPVGRLVHWIGKPKLTFNPCDYGDPYTKKTYLWGIFNELKQIPVKPIRVSSQGSWVQRLGGKSAKTKELRSITPVGFANAFFKANQ